MRISDWSSDVCSSDLTGNNNIDIFDFGAFAGEFNENYGTANTNCSTAAPHADISGNGVVFVEDYTFIVNNFLDVSEANCCTGEIGRASCRERVCQYV